MENRMSLKKASDEYAVFEIPVEQSEDEFRELYKRGSGMIIKFIPLSENHHYETAKARALQNNDLHPETQREFLTPDYQLRIYRFDVEKDDFILDPIIYKMRLFTIPKSLDIGSF